MNTLPSIASLSCRTLCAASLACLALPGIAGAEILALQNRLILEAEGTPAEVANIAVDHLSMAEAGATPAESATAAVEGSDIVMTASAPAAR